MSNQLIDYIDHIFCEFGTITQLGGRYSKEQHEYAKYVALALQENRKASFLEAETGIGKSLGYFIPMVLDLHLKMTQNKETKPIVISTFTRQLQKQIFNKDAVFAKQAIELLGFDLSGFKIAYRMGRASFFSVQRTKTACENLIFNRPDLKEEVQHFFNYVIESCESGSGLLSDWLAEYSTFPVGIQSKDICLLTKQKIDNEAYLYHLQKAKSANCLITNHATMINHKRVGFESNSFSSIIFDEAHKIESACNDHFNHYGSLKEILKSISQASELYPRFKKLNEASILIEQLRHDVTARYGKTRLNYISKANAPVETEQYFQTILKVNELLRKSVTSIDKKNKEIELDAKTASILANLDQAVNTLNHWKPEHKFPHVISAIHFSPKIKRLSLATVNLFASRLMAWIANDLSDLAIYTSATISDNKPSLSFKSIANALGYKDNEIGQQCSLSPINYGDMHFVLSQKHINAPISEISEETTVFDKQWLTNTKKMIEAAHAEGGAVLCLTTSHHESKVLANELSHLGPDLQYQKKNTAMNEYLADYINGSYKVFITSAGWEGLDLRKADNSQLLNHVVISRIPYSPPNELLEYFYKEYSKYKLQTESYSSKLNWLNQARGVVPKLKQGFGRGLRGPNDKVKIWIADPRMPHSNADRANNMLLYSIPKRFRSNYSKAIIFGASQKEVFMI